MISTVLRPNYCTIKRKSLSKTSWLTREIWALFRKDKFSQTKISNLKKWFRLSKFEYENSIWKFKSLLACYAHAESHNVPNFIFFTQLVVSRRLRRSFERFNFQRFNLRLKAGPVILDQTLYHQIGWSYQPTFDSKNRCDFTCRKVYESSKRKGIICKCSR